MVVVVVGLLAALVGGSKMLWALLAGVVVLAGLLALLGWGTLLLLRRLTVRNLALRLAINRLLRQPAMTLSQLAAFSLSFMLLALLLVMRGDLLDRWQQQLPADSPNFFLLNMTADQVPQVRDFLQTHQIKPETFYPIARMRLSELNGQAADPERDNALNRELNLTSLAALPAHNPLVAGNWPPAVGEVSMEAELAERLGVKLGDSLTFEGDTQQFSAKITSLRKVDWESLKPNFFFIFPPGALDSQPLTWLTSFRLDNNPTLLAQLNREFPTLSLLDIGSIMRQIGQVLTQVSQALEIMVVLVTACGILLLMAQIQVGMRQRRQELVVYRTLGAGKRLLRTTLWCEFALRCSVKSLISRGSPTGPCGWRYRCVARCCCRCAEVGWACVCSRAKRCSGRSTAHKKRRARQGCTRRQSVLKLVCGPANTAGIFSRQQGQQRMQCSFESGLIAVGQVQMAHLATLPNRFVIPVQMDKRLL